MSHKIVDEYFEYYNKYRKEYGEKVCILMQIGSFYEMEMVKNENEDIGNLDEIAKLLNIQITKKNKSITTVDRNNPYMAGFPSISLSKFLPILLDNGYTVVVIDQVSSPPNVKRKVVGVYSPSVYPIDLIYKESSKLCGISVEKTNAKQWIYCYCVIDINTNEIVLYSERLCESIVDNILEIIDNETPKEVILFCNEKNNLEFDADVPIHRYLNRRNESIEYQNEHFRKIFSHINFGLIEPIEYFQLEKFNMTSMILLLTVDFISSHNITYINNLCVPKLYEDSSYLKLPLNTVSQLNVVGEKTKGKTSNLFEIVNNTVTTLGKRHLKFLLTNPFRDTQQIQERYDLTEKLVVIHKELKQLLGQFGDIVFFHRKMSLGILSISEFCCLHENYLVILELVNLLETNGIPTIRSDTKKQLQEYMSHYTNVFTMSTENENFLKRGVDNQIDELYESVVNLEEKIEEQRKEYEKLLGGPGNYIKLCNTETDGYFFVCTKIRGQQLKQRSRELNLKFTSNTCKISSDLIDELSNKLVNYKQLFMCQMKRIYQEHLQHYFKKYNPIFEDLKRLIERIDVCYSNGITSTMYKYTRPIIKESKQAYLSAKAIRHPIIERVLQNTMYVPNDITLDHKQKGIILSALNSCGKSSLLRSVGLSIVLAQSGLYVPCERFEFSPFDTLISQVDMTDNLWKSKSSFVSEMSGLKQIIHHAGPKTLVLSDELTKGTEVISATSIFATAAVTLTNSDTKFIFTTHLQDVLKLDCIKTNDKIGIYHLSVEICNDNIIFERKLKPGPCSELYGLEVAKATGLDDKFMKMAFRLRNQLTKTKSGVLTEKSSRYNSKKIVEKCEICGYYPFEKTDIPLDVHHIIGQCTADSNNYVGHFHKNKKHNLVTLCKHCHQQTHAGKIQISGYIQTTKGVLLDFTKIDNYNGTDIKNKN
jgi:DNA mismatch repair protein MutS